MEKKPIISETETTLFATYGTDITIINRNGRKIIIENIFFYRHYEDKVKNILQDLEEPVNRKKIMNMNVCGESHEYLVDYLRGLSYSGADIISEDETGYFYDVIYEDFESWDKSKTLKYSQYLSSLLKFDFEYDESIEDLKGFLIPNCKIREIESLVIIKFYVSDN
jgi:hypothetical protein